MMIQPSAITPPNSCSSEHSLPSNILIIIWLTWPIGRDCTCQMEKAMAAHSSTLAWKIPWMEEPDGLQSMGSLRIQHDWVTSLSLFPFMPWRRKWQPTPVSLPGESQGRGSLVGCRHRVGHDWSNLAAAALAKNCIFTLHLKNENFKVL